MHTFPRSDFSVFKKQFAFNSDMPRKREAFRVKKALISIAYVKNLHVRDVNEHGMMMGHTDAPMILLPLSACNRAAQHSCEFFNTNKCQSELIGK